MLTRDDCLELLGRHVNERRFNHSLCVEQAALVLARRFGADEYKAGIAGLLHDCAKQLCDGEATELILGLSFYANDPLFMECRQLWHAPLGALIARRDYCVEDVEVLSAIECHTLGKADMTVLEKVIYLADAIEYSREGPEVEALRDTLDKNGLDSAILLAMEQSIIYVLEKKRALHTSAVDARNFMLRRLTSNAPHKNQFGGRHN